MNAQTERTVPHAEILKVVAEALKRTTEEKVPSKQQEMLRAISAAIGDGTDASPAGLTKLMQAFSPEQKPEDTPGTAAFAEKQFKAQPEKKETSDVGRR